MSFTNEEVARIRAIIKEEIAEHFAPAKPIGANICKTVNGNKGLDAMDLVYFISYISCSQEGNMSAGAILLKMYDIEGTEIEKWIPKKLCCNLDIDNNKVCVWKPFVKDQLRGVVKIAPAVPPALERKATAMKAANPENYTAAHAPADTIASEHVADFDNDFDDDIPF